MDFDGLGGFAPSSNEAQDGDDGVEIVQELSVGPFEVVVLSSDVAGIVMEPTISSTVALPAAETGNGALVKWSTSKLRLRLAERTIGAASAVPTASKAAKAMHVLLCAAHGVRDHGGGFHDERPIAALGQ